LELITTYVGLFFSAKALQTILVLTGPQDLYKRWADNSQDLNVEWNMDAAKQVLEAWQRRFTEVKEKKLPEEAFCILREVRSRSLSATSIPGSLCFASACDRR